MATQKQGFRFEAQIYKMVTKDKLVIGDLDYANAVFQHISPFHLENFGLPWRKLDGTYREGTTFEMLVDAYLGDRMIKNFLFDYLADYEVQLRHVVATVLNEAFGEYGYLDPGRFKNAEYHKNFINDLENELTRANEPFVRHFQPKGNKMQHVPVYVAVEVITLGTLTKVVNNMRRPEQKKVAAFYGVRSELVLNSYFKCFTTLRNTCAHHGRLSNRRFRDGCAILKEDQRTLEQLAPAYRPDPFRFFAMLLGLMHVMGEKSSNAIIALFQKTFAEHPHLAPRILDFPPHWERVLRMAAGLEALEK